MIKNKFLLFFRIIPFLLLPLLCHATESTTAGRYHNTHSPKGSDSVINFGDPNFPLLKKKWLAIQNKKINESLRIIQLGDSHTAADIMTGRFREDVQQALGDGGIGWIPPMRVPGQRHSLISYSAAGWSLKSSRSEEDPDYPMGGYIATPIADNAQLTIKLKDPVISHIFSVTLLVKQRVPNIFMTLTDDSGRAVQIKTQKINQWEYVKTTATLPITLSATSANSASFGGAWITYENQTGGIISPVGSNGAVQSSWSRWAPRWLDDLGESQGDLVIIAYGTNEAFSNIFDPKEFELSLVNGIREIRKNLPKATILIIGTPDSLLKKRPSRRGLCRHEQPPALMTVKILQRKVARQEKTLYWDWMDAMGGPCSMEPWAKLGLAQSGLIHMTLQGYQQSADMLFIHLKGLMK